MQAFENLLLQNNSTDFFQIFYPNSPLVCSKLKFVQMVVLLALLAKILADIVETLRVQYQNI